MTAPIFPFEASLLDRNAEERIAYFQNKTIRHRLQSDAYQRLLAMISSNDEAGIILVVGPTGVGKTTVRNKVVEVMTTNEMSAMQEDPGYMPVISVEAIAPESGNFNWKDFYHRSLQALENPFVTQTLPPALHRERLPLAFLNTNRTVIADYRRALEQGLHLRKTKVLLIDEAHHILKVASGRGVLNQMDTLKSLHSMTGAKLVLIGTYELLACIGLSGQLNRRSGIIHMPRYRFDVPIDIADYQDALYTLLANLPLKDQEPLFDELEFFYIRTAGCIGILKDWLKRALKSALNEGTECITKKRLEELALPPAQLKTIAAEIVEGETAFASSSIDELKNLLGVSDFGASHSYSTSAEPARATRKKRPGRRNPRRDPVGVE